MNHYPHHIGDFNSATRHLTRVERSLYRDLLDLYYDTERPLNSDFDKLARRVVAVTEDERAALAIVLEEFFVQQDDGWHNCRCDAEIAKYHGQIEQASRAGKASAAKRSSKRKAGAGDGLNAGATTVERPLNGRATNQNQNQNQNQEPSSSDGGDSSLARGDDDRLQTQADWADEFSTRYGLVLDLGNRNDREKFWPLATQWIAAGVTAGQMRTAVERARAMTTEPIAYLPAYVDRVLATMQSAPRNPADVARITVPGPTGPDPALVKIMEDAKRACPPPAQVRQRMAELTGRGRGG